MACWQPVQMLCATGMQGPTQQSTLWRPLASHLVNTATAFKEDQKKLYAAEKSFSKEGKEARKKRKKMKGLEDKQEQKEHMTYGAGDFGVENNGQIAEKKKRKRKN